MPSASILIVCAVRDDIRANTFLTVTVKFIGPLGIGAAVA